MTPEELAGFRHDLLRFARLQLRDDAAAEDAVQETLAAALAAAGTFAGKAQAKTWTFAILKNKIVDHIRQRVREPTLNVYDDKSPTTPSTPSSTNAGTGSRASARPAGVTPNSRWKTRSSGASSTPASNACRATPRAFS